MKKSLVLAMAMALGVTASAYAANPFSDVPAGHWAYDSLAKLADTGVIDGYPDGTFKGDETITRYEAAQITARAMAKGANVDKLAAEFSSELEALGVKVAALEKKADNVKITGQIRYHYASNSGDVEGVYGNTLRTRLFVNGQINDDWSYTARLENKRNISGTTTSNDNLSMNQAYVTGKIGGVNVVGGKYSVCLNSNVVDNITKEALQLSYGKKVKLTGVVIKEDQEIKTYVATVGAKLGVVAPYVAYYKTHAAAEADDRRIVNVGANFPVAKDLTANVEYMNGDATGNNDSNGYAVALNYKGAKAAVPGTWGLSAGYVNLPVATYLVSSTSTFGDFANLGNHQSEDGFKGWKVAASYAVAKNIVAQVHYTDVQGRSGDETKVKTLWSQVQFNF